ncbi:regulator of microtubule dynamics protein 1-like [Montipora foliosa]|uniref:regulator of microtubule dynamics protein 1-like n=1 Tax=Montipora foliosa TaxID=591990 RepID=UPI0035F18D62
MFLVTKMAPWLALFDFSFPFSLGQNILFGVSVGIGIGIGIGAGMAASRRAFPFQAEDQRLVVLFNELVTEIRELRSAVMKLEVCCSKDNPEVFLPLRDKGSEGEETDDLEEFYEMSMEEPLQSAPEIVNLKEVIDEVDALHSSNNTEDKYKIHGLLETRLQKDQQSCELTWRYARSFFDIASLKGKHGDFEGKRSFLYEGVSKAERALQLDCKSSLAHKWYAITVGSTSEFEPLLNQITLGAKYKDHIETAIELDNNDPSLYHLLGRWCFEIAMLSWWKRRAAATLVAEPPTSSLEEALRNFLKAEEIKPDFWLANLYWIGKCYYEKGDYQKAAEYLRKALSLPVSSEDDRESHNLAEELIGSL